MIVMQMNFDFAEALRTETRKLFDRPGVELFHRIEERMPRRATVGVAGVEILSRPSLPLRQRQPRLPIVQRHAGVDHVVVAADAFYAILIDIDTSLMLVVADQNVPDDRVSDAAVPDGQRVTPGIVG